MSAQKSKTKTVPPKKARVNGTAKTASSPFSKATVSALPDPYKMSKRQARKIAREVCSWEIRPEEIRKEVFTLVRKGHSFAFAKQLTLVLRLSFEISDYYEQLGAMNPGLEKAQRDGSIEKEIWKTLNQLNEEWKILIEIP